MTTKYTHDYSIMFCIDTDLDKFKVNVSELRQALINRINNMDDQEFAEAIDHVGTCDWEY